MDIIEKMEAVRDIAKRNKLLEIEPDFLNEAIAEIKRSRQANFGYTQLCEVGE